MINIELNALKGLNNIIKEKLPTYSNSMKTLLNSVNRLHNLYNNDIPLEHALKFAFLNTLQFKLNSFSSLLSELNKIKNNTKCCSKFINIICNPPSRLIVKIENMFEEINKKILEMINMEEKILGSAIRIEHPILQLAWISVGLNQLNDISIDRNIYIQSLMTMLKKEEELNEFQEHYYTKLITAFVNHLDNIGGTTMDSKISIFELNRIKITNDNKKSVKQLIESEYDNIILHKDEVKDNSNVFLLTPLNTLNQLHLINKELDNDSISNLTINSNSMMIDIESNNSIKELIEDEIKEKTPISMLKRLNTFNTDNNDINEKTPISMLKRLNTFNKNNNDINEKTPISMLKRLNTFNTNNNDINEKTPISMLKRLNTFNKNENNLTLPKISPKFYSNNLYIQNLKIFKKDEDDNVDILNAQTIKISDFDNETCSNNDRENFLKNVLHNGKSENKHNLFLPSVIDSRKTDEHCSSVSVPTKVGRKTYKQSIDVPTSFTTEGKSFNCNINEQYPSVKLPKIF
jgi:hypothetical protein